MITYGSTTLTSYNSIVNTEVYYYQSTSATELLDGEWSTIKPEWENGKYVWQKIKTIYEDNTSSESDPVNITGQQGLTGISYKLTASSSVIIKDKRGQLTSSSITFSASMFQGLTSVQSYEGRFLIETYNGEEWITETAYSSIIDEVEKEYDIPSNIVDIRCSLYQSGGFVELLDQMTVPIISEGADGISELDAMPVYCVSDLKEGVTIKDNIWSRYMPETDDDHPYLWVYYVSRYGIAEPELLSLSGEAISFEYHGEESPLESVEINVDFVQTGSGDPSASNIRPITGWTAITINQSDVAVVPYNNTANELVSSEDIGTIEENTWDVTDSLASVENSTVVVGDEVDNTIIIDFLEAIGTVYGGVYNVTTGDFIVTHGYIESYNGETLPGLWVSDRDVYAEGTTPTTGAQVVYELEEPIHYSLRPREINAIVGGNSLRADTGDISITYYDNQKTTEPQLTYSVTQIMEDIKSLEEDVQEARRVAINYLSRDESGIMVADMNDGVQAPMEATGFNTLIDNESVRIREGLKDIATYKGTGIGFNDQIPFKIGNNNTYIQYYDNNGDGIAETLQIVADKISFRVSEDVQDIQQEFDRLNDGVGNIQTTAENIRASTENSINRINNTVNAQNSKISEAQAATSEMRRYIDINPATPSISVGVGDTRVEITSQKTSYIVDGNETAYTANDRMNFPSASVTNLYMQTTDVMTGTPVGALYWVMRSNGHLSLKALNQ